jgi:hypothetical protein
MGSRSRSSVADSARQRPDESFADYLQRTSNDEQRVIREQSARLDEHQHTSEVSSMRGDTSQHTQDQSDSDDRNDLPDPKDTPDIRKKIAAAFKRMEKIDAERKALNEEKAAEFDKLEALGVRRKGAKAAYSRFKSKDDEDRESIDFSYALCCKAVDIGIQEELLPK